MLIEGGIYTHKTLDAVCLIVLKISKKTGRIWIASMTNINKNEFSKKKIQKRLYFLKSKDVLDMLNYWSFIDENLFNANIDGYLGNVDEDLYQKLLIELKKSKTEIN